jgi:hypothetical protein
VKCNTWPGWQRVVVFDRNHLGGGSRSRYVGELCKLHNLHFGVLTSVWLGGVVPICNIVRANYAFAVVPPPSASSRHPCAARHVAGVAACGCS